MTDPGEGEGANSHLNTDVEVLTLQDRILRAVAERELQRERRPAWPGRFLRRLLPRRLTGLEPASAADLKVLAGQKLGTRQQRRAAGHQAMFREVSQSYPGEPRRARRKIARALTRARQGEQPQ